MTDATAPMSMAVLVDDDQVDEINFYFNRPVRILRCWVVCAEALAAGATNEVEFDFNYRGTDGSGTDDIARFTNDTTNESSQAATASQQAIVAAAWAANVAAEADVTTRSATGGFEVAAGGVVEVTPAQAGTVNTGGATVGVDYIYSD